MRYAMLLLLAGCASSHAENAAKAATYGAELDLCVQKATTLAESQACRCDVSKRYARPCDVTDAGHE